MNFDELQQLVAQGESEKLEFKKSTAQIPRIGEALCGFLNHRGGHVLVGVTDNGNILGQHVTDKTRQELAQLLTQFEPPAHVAIEYIPVPGTDKQVIIFTVSIEERSVPSVYQGRPYQRVQTTTALMPQATYQRLLIEGLQKNHKWEDLPARGVKLSDLDEDAIWQTVNAGIQHDRLGAATAKANIEEVLTRLKLMRDGLLLNSAVVLYARDPFYYPQCLLRLARFKGLDKHEFMDNQQVSGHAFKLLDEAFHFINKHLPIAGRIVPGQLERQEDTIFPHNAIREALINALCHRDYTIYGGAIHLAIYDDRLEIWSPGGLPFGQRIEQLKQTHVSHPRNPNIANVFYRHGLIESWGRGTQDIIQYSLNLGNPEPEFSEQAGNFCVFFPSRIPIGLQGYVAQKLSLRQQAILRILAKSALPLRDIVAQIEDAPAAATVYDDLAHLKALGVIDKQGHGRGATWHLIKSETKK